MKQLILARHAKSSWDELYVSDAERGLSKRGKRDLLAVGHRLDTNGFFPDLILYSPAKRTKKTAFSYAKTCLISTKNIKEKEALYLATKDELIRIIETIPEHIRICMLVGHNPGLTELANLCGYSLDNLPTCGVVIFRYEGAYRGDFLSQKCVFENYITPKLLSS